MTTERWNDEMVDDLASTVEQTTRNVDMLVGAVNALLERDSRRDEETRRRDEEMRRRDEDFQQYKLENDQRFNILLEEVRFLIRKLGEDRS
ncbi:MAG: hypothetical protein WCD53_16370 [Microcoleus sp.]